MTEEQLNRDKQITKLLRHYVDFYKDKIETNKKYKNFLFWICMVILLCFSLIFGCVVAYAVVLSNNDNMFINNVYNVISVSVTFITLIIGILTIITKYVFPQDDEKYITQIVELIQTNDLENKKENINIDNY